MLLQIANNCKGITSTYGQISEGMIFKVKNISSYSHFYLKVRDLKKGYYVLDLNTNAVMYPFNEAMEVIVFHEYKIVIGGRKEKEDGK